MSQKAAHQPRRRTGGTEQWKGMTKLVNTQIDDKESRHERRGQKSKEMDMVTHVILRGEQMTVQVGDASTVCELG